MQATHNYLALVVHKKLTKLNTLPTHPATRNKTITMSMETAVLLAPCLILLPQAKRTGARQTACISAKPNNTC
jgi:hypothetical protein